MCSSLKSIETISKFNTYEPNQIWQEKALIELRETPHNIQKGLKDLRNLLAAEKDLNVPLKNDEWLLMFLRTCKFYPNSATDLIKRYYSLRLKYNEITRLILPSRLKQVFHNNLVSFLSQRDQHGRRIIVTLGGNQWNPKFISREHLFASGVLCTDLLQKDCESQINGVVYILDLEGLTFGHLLQYTPFAAKRCLDFIQDTASVRIKGFHIVNQPKIFQPVFGAIKQFFNPKYGKRILMHGHNYASLHQYISPECLPKCYGGTLDSQLMASRETYELLAEHEDFFRDLQGYGFKNL